MMVRTRFAPSPTGRLHLGHVLAARVAHDMARARQDGVFLLRFEDIDATRIREPFYRGITEDLEWLGLHWDETPLRQSGRVHAYQSALETLRQRGLAYPCFCTRREIQDEWARMAAAPHGPEGPLYPGSCREIDDARRAEMIAAGVTHAWRLDARKAALETGPIDFHDLRHGVIAVDPLLLGDVVLARKDIGTAYHLAVVVDDAFQQITHVTRGEDLLASTHVHRLLQVLLGLPAPDYLHHALLPGDDGKRLAKRHDALAVATLRESGHTAAGVISRTDPFMPALAKTGGL
jgi:glutamyl-Q tRNA(Asp) synthetase